MTLVALAGGTGKLGRIIRSVIEAEPGYELSAVLTSASELTELDGADLVVDATNYEASERILAAALERGANVLVGTSGWSADRIERIRPAVERAGTGVVFVPNFSLGSVIGSAIAATASRFFDSAEIIEAHRDTKVDSPSGTAVRTAEL
ncbi:MAG: dihydrodipicolinate reductase C-terminal domain-containing protein, partial [Microbacterium gubbeenense]